MLRKRKSWSDRMEENLEKSLLKASEKDIKFMMIKYWFLAGLFIIGGIWVYLKLVGN